jgi:hypothetical protein
MFVLSVNHRECMQRAMQSIESSIKNMHDDDDAS